MQNYFLFGIFIQFCQYFMQIYITLVRASAKFEIDESEYIDIIFINKSFLKNEKERIMSRITAFYITSYEKILDRAKRTFENCFDGDVEFIDFCIDEPTISNGAIEKAKSSDAVWYFAPHFSSASAPLSLIRAKLGLFANVQIVQDGEKEDEYFVCDESRFPESSFSSSTAFGRQAKDVNTLSELEIEKVLRIAYELAEMKAENLTLVLPVEPTAISSLWRKIAYDIAEDYPFVSVEVVDSVEATVRVSTSNLSRVCVGMREQLRPLCTLSATLGGCSVSSMSLGETTLGSYECLSSSDERVVKSLVENTLSFSYGLLTEIDNLAE